MLVAGNHDSPERVGYASRLLSDKQLYLCGGFDGTIRKAELSDEYGPVCFWLLPFIRPSTVRALAGIEDREDYNEMMAAALATADIDYTCRNILVSHQLYVKVGVAASRSESELSPVGGLDGIDVGAIEGFDYAALGHLHKAQEVGREHLRYAGSPIKYSFSEWSHIKSVTLVDIKEKGNIAITALPLSPIHDMREIKGGINALINDDVASLIDREDYIRAVLTDEEEIIDPMGKLRAVYPNIMGIVFENARTSAILGEIYPDIDDTEKQSPYDLFAEFFLNMQGSAMSREQEEIVRKLMDGSGGGDA
jgi:exonuclease SbcD